MSIPAENTISHVFGARFMRECNHSRVMAYSNLRTNFRGDPSSIHEGVKEMAQEVARRLTMSRFGSQARILVRRAPSFPIRTCRVFLLSPSPLHSSLFLHHFTIPFLFFLLFSLATIYPSVCIYCRVYSIITVFSPPS